MEITQIFNGYSDEDFYHVVVEFNDEFEFTVDVAFDRKNGDVLNCQAYRDFDDPSIAPHRPPTADFLYEIQVESSILEVAKSAARDFYAKTATIRN